MKARERYEAELRTRSAWDEYLLENSGLPGPRGNLELAQAVADLGTPQLFARYRRYTASKAPTQSPEEFLAFCGVLGLGRLLAEGDLGSLGILRRSAADPRWRIREAVAMALQRWGKADMEALIREMKSWATGGDLERRAAVAALCEPALLQQASHARATLRILDSITGSILQSDDRRSDAFRALRQGLGYGWSVAVVAAPEEGKAAMERWMTRRDPDVRWIMKQNLSKKRLARLDPKWVARWNRRLETAR
jgi:hypothetical protein